VIHDKPDRMWDYLLRIEGHNVLRGPCSTEDMIAMLSSGDINEKTSVRQLVYSSKTLRYEVDSGWRAAAEFSALSPYISKKLGKSKKASQIRTWATVGIALLLILIWFLGRFSLLDRLNSDEKPSAEYTLDKMNPIKPPSSKETPREIPTSQPIAPMVIQSPLASSASTVAGIIKETNMVRQKNGLPPLTENGLLDRVADERVEDMLRQQYFGHISPSGQGAAEIMQRVGYHYKILGENIGSMSMYATDRRFVEGWMQSPGHRENLMNEEVRDIGVAVRKGFIKGREQWVAVQVFGLQSLPVTHQAGRKATVPEPRRAPNKAESELIFRVVK
jgi:uncharacterized protein YkwD